MKPAYYNEHDPYCAQWLRNLIAAGHIPAGDVDERDIRAVEPAELAGYGQLHLFAGLGGWALACRLAGYADDADILTGSPPCQPFSVAGQRRGTADDRHLWPEMARLVASLRPAVVGVENVANVVGLALDGMQSELDREGYASRAFILPACAVNAPHRRDRVWIVARNLADADRIGSQGAESADAQARGRRPANGGGAECAGSVADATCELPHRGGHVGPGRRREPADGGCWDGAVADADGTGSSQERQQRGGQQLRTGGDPGALPGIFWDNAGWITGRDGKARRVPQSGICGVVDGTPAGMAGVRSGHAEDIPLLAHGVPDRVAKLRALGNAIVPQVAAEILKAVRAP